MKESLINKLISAFLPVSFYGNTLSTNVVDFPPRFLAGRLLDEIFFCLVTNQSQNVSKGRRSGAGAPSGAPINPIFLTEGRKTVDKTVIVIKQGRPGRRWNKRNKKAQNNETPISATNPQASSAATQTVTLTVSGAPKRMAGLRRYAAANGINITDNTQESKG